jgi:hypothetical protein
MLRTRTVRPAAHTVEAALIFPLVFFFLLALVVGALGMFRYHQVCHLAREAARFASTHGGQYNQENHAAIRAGTLPHVNEQYIKTNLVAAHAPSMDLASITTTIAFNTSGGNYGWDDTHHNGHRWPTSSKTVNGTTYTDTNTVSVTVSYTWIPEMYLIGPITLTSTSVMPMCY